MTKKEENNNIRLRLFYTNINLFYYEQRFMSAFSINITHKLKPSITYYD